MDTATLKSIILEQNNLRNASSSTLREKLSSIESYLNIPHAVIISGIRRCGKSTLLAQILKNYFSKEIFYLSFEDERFIDFTSQDFNHLYEIFVEIYGERKIFFLDELQNIPKWELFVRRMQDQDFKFFITGSNASLLSRELGTRLTGRWVMIALFPFSFREYLDFKNIKFEPEDIFHTRKRGLLKRNFNHYLKEGGMPEYLKYQDTSLLKRTYEDILYRDIIVRHDIRDVKALRELCLFLISNISSLISYNKIKGLLGLGSVNTVKNYIQYLEDAYLFFTVNQFSFSVKQQAIAPKKIYAIDNGIAEAVAFQFSKNQGHYLENLVFLELKRNGHEIFYYKTKSGQEVDFVIREKNQLSQLIQVVYAFNDKAAREREINALAIAMIETNCHSGLILTDDHKETLHISHQKISVLPVYQWLLNLTLNL